MKVGGETLESSSASRSICSILFVGHSFVVGMNQVLLLKLVVGGFLIFSFFLYILGFSILGVLFVFWLDFFLLTSFLFLFSKISTRGRSSCNCSCDCCCPCTIHPSFFLFLHLLALLLIGCSYPTGFSIFLFLCLLHLLLLGCS